MRKRIITIILASVFFLNTGFVFSDSLRGRVTSVLEVSPQSPGNNTGNFKLTDLVSISAEAGRFIQGIEIEIKIPGEIKKYRNSFALYLYKRIRPAPSREIKTYTAGKAVYSILPSSNRFFIYIPLVENHNLGPSPGSIITDNPVQPADFPLILTIIPVMKGVPDITASSLFEITASPVYIDSGLLQLKLEAPEIALDDSLRAYIDNTAVSYTDTEFVLETGLHQLRVESEIYENQVLSFGIEKGQNTVLNIKLQKIITVIRLEAPENAVLYMDGEKLDISGTGEIETTPGEHTVLIKVGDYRTSKVFLVEKGKNYKISLFLDILIQDD